MGRKVVKVTMQIWRVRTHTDNPSVLRPPGFCRNTNSGFTFTELVVVIVIVSLFVSLAQVNLFGLLRRSKFKAEIQDFVSTLRMTVTAAAESDRRYEVIIDIPDQSFLMRQITSPDLSEVLEEEIITQSYFAQTCRVVYVEFDDGDFTNEGRAKFRAGRTGWQYGGKIVLVDNNEQYYSIILNRLNRMVLLEKGDIQLLQPKAVEDIPWL